MKRAMILAAFLLLAACGGDDAESTSTILATAAAPTTEPLPATTTTAVPPTTTVPSTTTLPPTTTTTEPPFVTISDGVYIVGTEVPPGVYRHTGYMARLDENQEIIDNSLVNDGLGLLIVHEDDAYVEVSGEAVLADDFGPFDPIAQGATDGRYLVGVDIQPGEYRITPAEGDSAYWSRLDEDLEIINNNLSDGQLIVTVQESDYTLEFRGTLELIG